MSLMQEYILHDRDRSFLRGSQRVYKFPNGYGASVITGGYGDLEHPYEVAVLQFEDGDKYELTYGTPITDDVIGHLDADDVNNILNQIKELPNDRIND